MKPFHCQHCGQLVFFENVQCLRCGHSLGYMPDAGVLSAIESAQDGCWYPLAPEVGGRLQRQCANWLAHGVCNWLVPAEAGGPALCRACGLNRMIPDLAVPENRDGWGRLEAAKRRLVYSLLSLGLPVRSKQEDPDGGLAFDFLARPQWDLKESSALMIGHQGGIITLDVAEANDAFRERMRIDLKEAYRTLLGHFRHESGHYYWGRLIRNRPHLARYRELFGDEGRDYDAALQAHYRSGPPADWAERFVSAYAAAHPWEDFAETWAHYLHITDTLETVRAFGISMRVLDEEETAAGGLGSGYRPERFQAVIDRWLPFTYALNSIARSMGQADVYPFVLPPAVVSKLNFVHEVVSGAADGAC